MSGETTEAATPASRLFQLIWPGGLAAQAVFAAAQLRLADLLADSPATAAELATRVNAHPPSLHRLLRALSSLGMFREAGDGRFHPTDLSETLRTDRPDSAHAWAVFLGSPFLWNAWGGLYESVRTGSTAFQRVHGVSFYEHVAANPDDAAIYDTAMNAGSTATAEAVVDAFDFSRFHLVVDVGGGQGALLRGILAANPRVRGILFDLPAVVAGATELRRSDVAERCTIVGGDAFESVPGGGDACLLKSVVHSFDDDAAVRILQNCRRALPPDGRLLLVEIVLPPGIEPDPGKALMDLMMLTLVPGRERTRAEFETLLRAAGFTLERVVPTRTGNSILEAKPDRATSMD